MNLNRRYHLWRKSGYSRLEDIDPENAVCYEAKTQTTYRNSASNFLQEWFAIILLPHILNSQPGSYLSQVGLL